ncbi:hypothetical protein GMD78_06035 [Ornithinibacillus sp. L9]|uniref:Uncharacterized protein n=1 Tax=Ornithinibacillus caprae TaxID=2678566 RepID=A0A6N8FGZ0_9BACI|nr:CBO0543 family protein [Ornithinibacillus caprae]MUK87956.1 hypothetical protein [Ornithinibacillus caprae]
MEQQDYFDRNLDLFEKLFDLQKQQLDLWLENVLWTPLWWVGVCLSIVPWILWLLFANKASRNRMLYTGFIVMLIASFLDFLGSSLGLWLYNYQVFPWVPAYVPWDVTLIPVVIMSLIEIKPKASPVVKGFIFAVLTSSVGEIVFEFLGLYKKVHWESYYSFPIYFLLFLVGYWASLRKNYADYRKKDS